MFLPTQTHAKRFSKTATILVVFFFLITQAQASFVIEEGIHIAFHDQADLITGAEITFSEDTITYGNGSINIGSAWLNSTCDMILTAFTSDWINFTIDSGTRPVVDRGSLPTSVWIGGVSRYQGNGWEASGTQVTITESTTNVALYYGTSQDVTPSPYPSVQLPMILFFASWNGEPVKGVRIELFKDMLFAGSMYTLDDGYTEKREVPDGWYTYKALYNGNILEGNFTAGEDETITLEFAGLSVNVNVRTSLMKASLAIVVVACAIVAILAVKNRH